MSGVRRFQDLEAWKRAYELQVLSEELLARPRVASNKKFRDQLSDAASSAARSIAEGFGRYRPRENAQYVRIAKGSANEVLSLFFEARAKRYLKEEEFPRFETAANRRVSEILCVGHSMRRLYAPEAENGEAASRSVGADPC